MRMLFRNVQRWSFELSFASEKDGYQDYSDWTLLQSLNVNALRNVIGYAFTRKISFEKSRHLTETKCSSSYVAVCVFLILLTVQFYGHYSTMMNFFQATLLGLLIAVLVNLQLTTKLTSPKQCNINNNYNSFYAGTYVRKTGANVCANETRISRTENKKSKTFRES